MSKKLLEELDEYAFSVSGLLEQGVEPSELARLPDEMLEVLVSGEFPEWAALLRYTQHERRRASGAKRSPRAR